MKFERDLKGKKGKAAVLFLIAALALLFSSIGFTMAKYFRQDSGSGAAAAAPFYFTSDRLNDENPYYQIDEPDDGETVQITFHFSNYVDRLRRTNADISYSYRAVSGTDLSAASIANTEGTGTLLKGDFRTSADVTLNLSKSDFADGVVTVAATTTSPYKKTIRARFGFTAQQHDLQWTVTDSGSAVVLELAGGNGGQVRVAWPNTIFPDLSNRIFDGAASGQVTFTAEPGVRYAMTFLKADPTAEVSEADFTVTSQ